MFSPRSSQRSRQRAAEDAGQPVQRTAATYHLEAIFLVASVCSKDIARLVNVANLAHLGQNIEGGGGREEAEDSQRTPQSTGARLLSAKEKNGFGRQGQTGVGRCGWMDTVGKGCAGEGESG